MVVSKIISRFCPRSEAGEALKLMLECLSVIPMCVLTDTIIPRWHASLAMQKCPLERTLVSPSSVKLRRDAGRVSPPHGRKQLWKRPDLPFPQLFSPTGKELFQCHHFPGSLLHPDLTEEGVERHDGHIEVRSVVGEGSTFSVFLLLFNAERGEAVESGESGDHGKEM